MNTFDIYDLKENKFLNLSINIDEAKAEKKKSSSYIIVPDIYKNIENGIDKLKAKEIATREFKIVSEKNPDRYGSLKETNKHPMWYIFVANDYKLQAEGYTPGYWGCYIDKISGEIVSKEDVLYYPFL